MSHDKLIPPYPFLLNAEDHTLSIWSEVCGRLLHMIDLQLTVEVVTPPNLLLKCSRIMVMLFS